MKKFCLQKSTTKWLLLLLVTMFSQMKAQVFEQRLNLNLSTTYFTEVTACEHLSNGNNIIALTT
jgi:hypothetical protein